MTLGGAWHVNLEDGSTSSAQQSTRVVEHGVLYVQTTQQNKDTGQIVWQRQLITDGEGGGDTGGCDPESGQRGGLTGTLAGAVAEEEVTSFHWHQTFGGPLDGSIDP
ncbi:hypothetical protein [Nonomuraea fuscirosea]|uniref:hypothetical protein n=1 Tax=Nonomuraea fuscirosea TaxID=1291556 RepID=UPI003420B6D9